MNNITQKILEYFNCPYTVFTKDIKPKVIEEDYLKALEDCKGKDWYPALVISNEDLLYVITNHIDRKQLIIDCEDNGKEKLDSRCYIEDIDIEEDEEIFYKKMGKKRTFSPVNHFVALMLLEDTLEEVILFQIPVGNPWELIAWLPIGGWNEYLDPKEMISVAKYWYEQYGAVPAVFKHDMLEFYLEKEVRSDVTIGLAIEHVALCPDRINQGTKTGTISEIAASLVDEHVWTFWWD